jgi:hypothetical protein
MTNRIANFLVGGHSKDLTYEPGLATYVALTLDP